MEPKLKVLGWEGTHPLVLAKMKQAIVLGMDFIMTAKRNFLFSQGEPVFGAPRARREQTPNTRDDEATWKPTEDFMTRPRKLPPTPEEELPALTWTTPRITRKRARKEKDARKKRPFLVLKDGDEEDETLPAKRTTKGGRANKGRLPKRANPPTGTVPGTPTNLCGGTAEITRGIARARTDRGPRSSRQERRRGQRLIDQCPAMQLRMGKEIQSGIRSDDQVRTGAECQRPTCPDAIPQLHYSYSQHKRTHPYFFRKHQWMHVAVNTIGADRGSIELAMSS